MKKLRRISRDDGVRRRRLYLATTAAVVLAATIAIQNKATIDEGLLFLDLENKSSSSSRSLSLRQDTPIEMVQQQQQQQQQSQLPELEAPPPPQADVVQKLPTPILDAELTTTTTGARASAPLQEKKEELEEPLPTTKSLHPKWKLWHEMNEQQQQAALREVAPYMRKYGQMIARRNFKLQIPQHQVCELWIPGSAHRLCGPAPAKPCTFLSFGINNDPSYDLKLADEWGCRGFAADPTVIHPSKLHPLVTFHNIGLTTLRPNEEKLVRPEEDWWYTSMPALRKFLKLDHVDIMKIDCEGCEVALSRDILVEDPTFFSHITQMTIETHITKAWIETQEELYYFALLFPLLEEAGHVMVSSMVFGCNIKHERYGCMPEFGEWGFSCGLGPNRKVVKSCHDFLFVKKEKAYRNGIPPPPPPSES